MSQGGREVLGQEVDLEPDSPPLRIVFKAGVGSVRGTVEKGDGATVVLLPAESSPDAVSIIRTFHCGRDGAFEIADVAPGSYRVAAFDHIGIEELTAPDFAASILSSGTQVGVEESSTSTVELRVTRWPFN